MPLSEDRLGHKTHQRLFLWQASPAATPSPGAAGVAWNGATLRTGAKVVLPEILEPIGRQSRIADRAHDRAVPEIGLDGASVVAVVGELEPAGVPQHVGMNEKGEFRCHPRPGNHALISGCGKRCASFGHEDVRRCWRFAQELPQCSAFTGGDRMHAGIPALGPAYM
jgi:hypothetical protein